MEERIKYLESLLPSKDVEDKHRGNFEKYATYVGNGVYQWCGIVSADTRALFLMGCLHKERIPFETE